MTNIHSDQNSPTQQPFVATGNAGVGEAMPKELLPNAGNDQNQVGLTAPSANPPTIQAGANVGAAVWHSDKRVNGLWSINENRNSWVSLEGVGFKRLSTATDSGIVALTMLSAHARQLQRSYSCREESDGMIHEAYVW